MSMSVCLAVMFNHAFPANLPFLRRIYRDRFSRLRFIQPLQRSPDPDVITVYRGCYSFPAYITDACARLLEIDCTHYLFMHDDVLFSPGIDEHNLLDILDLHSEDEGFIPRVSPFDMNITKWGFTPGGVWRWLHPRNILSGTGVDSVAASLAALPPVDYALERLSRYGIDHLPKVTLSSKSFNEWGETHHFPIRDVEEAESFNRRLLKGLFRDAGSEIELPYPLAFCPAYSDFCVIPRAALTEVGHIAGVLAAAGVPHEMILATALLIAVDTVKMGFDTGVELDWGDNSPIDPEAVLAQMARTPSLIAAHPLKLSKIADKDALADRLADAASIPMDRFVPHGRVMALAPDFDPHEYHAANPDVPVRSAYHHYFRFGNREQRALRPG